MRSSRGHGTLKISHVNPGLNPASDANAAAISIDLQALLPQHGDRLHGQRRRRGAEHRPSADWQPRVPDRQYQPGADIYAGGLGVSAVAILGRAADRRAQMAVTAGWPDVGRA